MSEAVLAGRTVAITSERRREEQRAYLERRGATVVEAPCVQTVSPEADTELVRALHELIADPPAVVMIQTGGGIHRILETANAVGLDAPLRAALARSRVIARGAKSARVAKQCGLEVAWFGPNGRSRDAVDWLARERPRGRVAVQLDGHEDAQGLLAPFAAVVEHVIPLPVYRWTVPDDARAVEALVDDVCARAVDAVLFTSSPAVLGLASVATKLGRTASLSEAFAQDVLAACIGEVCAATARSHGVRPGLVPDRPRLGSLLAATASRLSADRADQPTPQEVRDSAPHPTAAREAPLTTRIEVQRTIPASCDAIFAVLRDPSGHVSIDSSGMLMGATGDAVSGVGERFTVHMDREALNDYPLGTYDVEVIITAYEPDREIAWTVDGQLKPPIGHVYGYLLEPGEDGTSVVTSYYDWSDIHPDWAERDIFPVLDEGALRATLGILARTVAPTVGA